MTEESIIKDLAQWLDNRKFPFQIPRAFIYDWESDFWCMTQDGETREFEIKISRSDFAVDKKKAKHSDTTKGANYFYYVCPANVIMKEEVPANYGLIYVTDYKLSIIKKPKRLHDTKFGNWRMLANKMYWKWYTLWHAKYIAKEITLDDYRAGFNYELVNNDNLQKK